MSIIRNDCVPCLLFRERSVHEEEGIHHHLCGIIYFATLTLTISKNGEGTNHLPVICHSPFAFFSFYVFVK